MGLFNTFLKQRQPKGFDYKPRFYDPELEERREKLKKLRTVQGKDMPNEKTEDYAPGNIIRERMSAKFDNRQKNKSVPLIRIITFACILFFVIYLIYTKDLTKFFSIFIKH